MDKQPKLDRFLLWLFEHRPGDSKVKAQLKMVAVILVGALVVLSAFQGARWLALSW